MPRKSVRNSSTRNEKGNVALYRRGARVDTSTPANRTLRARRPRDVRSQELRCGRARRPPPPIRMGSRPPLSVMILCLRGCEFQSRAHRRPSALIASLRRSIARKTASCDRRRYDSRAGSIFRAPPPDRPWHRHKASCWLPHALRGPSKASAAANGEAPEPKMRRPTQRRRRPHRARDTRGRGAPRCDGSCSRW